MSFPPERIQREAEAVYDVLIEGGIAIVPLDVAYAIVGHTGSAIKKYFRLRSEVLTNRVECSHAWTIR